MEYSDYSGEKSTLTCPCVALTPFPIITWHPAVGASNCSIEDFCRGLEQASKEEEKEEVVHASLDMISPITAIRGRFLDTKQLLRGSPYICEYLDLSYLSRGRMQIVSQHGAFNLTTPDVCSWLSLHRNPYVLLRIAYDMCTGLSFLASKGLNHQCLSLESIVQNLDILQQPDSSEILSKQVVSLANSGLYTFLDKLKFSPTLPSSILLTSPERIQELFQGSTQIQGSKQNKSNTACLGNMGNENNIHNTTYTQFYNGMKNDMYGVGFTLLYLLRCMVSYGKKDQYPPTTSSSTSTHSFSDFLLLFLTQQTSLYSNADPKIVCKHCQNAPLYTSAGDTLRTNFPDLHQCAKCWLNPKFVIYPKFKYINDTRGFVQFYASLVNSLLAPASQRSSQDVTLVTIKKYLTTLQPSFVHKDLPSTNTVYQSVAHSVEEENEHTVLTSIRTYVDKRRLQANLTAHQDTVKLALATVIAAGGLGYDPDPAQANSLHWSHDLLSISSTYLREDDAQPYKYQASSYSHKFQTMAVTRDPDSVRISESTVVDFALNDVFTNLNNKIVGSSACIEGAVSLLTDAYVTQAKNLSFKLKPNQVTPYEPNTFEPSLLATCSVYIASYMLEKAYSAVENVPLAFLWDLYACHYIKIDILPNLLGIQYPPAILTLPIHLTQTTTMTNDLSPIRSTLVSMKAIITQFAAEKALFDLAPLFFLAMYTQPQPNTVMCPMTSSHPAIMTLLKTQNMSRTSLHTILHIICLSKWKHSVHNAALQTTVHSIRLYLIAEYVKANFDCIVANEILSLVYQHSVCPSTVVATRSILNSVPTLTLTNTFKEHIYCIYTYDSVHSLNLTHELHNSVKGTYYINTAGQKVYTGKPSSKTSAKMDTPIVGYIYLHNSKYDVYGKSDRTDMYYIDDKGKTHTLQSSGNEHEQHLLETLLPLQAYSLPTYLKSLYLPVMFARMKHTVQLKPCLSPSTAVYLYADTEQGPLSGETLLQQRKDLPRCFPASDIMSSPSAIAIIKTTLKTVLLHKYTDYIDQNVQNVHTIALQDNILQYGKNNQTTLQGSMSYRAPCTNILLKQPALQGTPFLLTSLYANAFPLLLNTMFGWNPSATPMQHSSFQAFQSVLHTTGSTYSTSGCRNLVTFPIQQEFDCVSDAYEATKQEVYKLSKPKNFASILDNVDKYTQHAMAYSEERMKTALSLLQAEVKQKNLDQVTAAEYIFPENPVYWQGFDSIVATATSFAHSLTQPILDAQNPFQNIAHWLTTTQNLVSTLLRKQLWPLLTAENSKCIHQLTSLTEQIVQFHNPTVAVHLFRQNWTAQTFGVPLYLTLFSHQCAPQTTHILWEALLFYPPEFMVFLVVAALLHIKEDLLMQDVASMAPTFHRYIAHVDGNEWVQHAVELMHNTPVFLLHQSPWLLRGSTTKVENKVGKAGLSVASMSIKDIALLCILNNCMLEKSSTTTYQEKPLSSTTRLLGGAYPSTLTHLYSHFFKNILQLPEQQIQQQTQEQQQEVYEDRIIEYSVTDNNWRLAPLWCIDQSLQNKLHHMTYITSPQSVLVQDQQGVFISMAKQCGLDKVNTANAEDADIPVELALQALTTLLNKAKEDEHEPIIVLVAERSKVAFSLARKLVSHGFAKITVGVTNEQDELHTVSSINNLISSWGSSLHDYLTSLLECMKTVISTMEQDKTSKLSQTKQQFVKKTGDTLTLFDTTLKKTFVEQFSNRNTATSPTITPVTAAECVDSHQTRLAQQEQAIQKIIQDTTDTFQSTRDIADTLEMPTLDIEQSKQRIEVLQSLSAPMTTSLDAFVSNDKMVANTPIMKGNNTPVMKSQGKNSNSTNTPVMKSTIIENTPELSIPAPLKNTPEVTSMKTLDIVKAVEPISIPEPVKVEAATNFTFHDDGKSDIETPLHVEEIAPVVGIHFNFDDFDLDNLESME